MYILAWIIPYLSIIHVKTHTISSICCDFGCRNPRDQFAVGFEHTTSCSGIKYSIQLSYGCVGGILLRTKTRLDKNS